MHVGASRKEKEEQIAEHERIKRQDENDLKGRWTNTVEVDPEFEHWCPKIIETLTTYTNM